jgi:hypothetical protein
VKFLKDKFKGEECYILTAGPSIKDYSSEYLKKKLKNKLVISVKQTYDLVDDIVDFHLLNPFNYRVYDYKKNNPIVVMVNLLTFPKFTPNSKEDLRFFIDRRKSNKKNSLAYNKNFDDYLLDNNLIRPFGPGIMYEIGIYLAVHLGVSSINVLGWDLGELKSNEIKRFYENKGLLKKTEKKVINISPFLYNMIFIRFINLYNLLKYLMGYKFLLNNPGVSNKEASFIAQSTKQLYLWLKQKKIYLFIISKKSMIDEIVPRKNL